MKRFFALIVLFPLLSIAYTTIDVSNAEFLAQKEVITKQTSEKGYRLDDNITRAEVIGIALKIKWTSLPTDYQCKKYFSDTVTNDWVCRAIEMAADQGIISRENAKSRSQDSITRSEAFAILYKISGLTPTKNDNNLISKDTDAAQWQQDLFLKIHNSGLEVPGTEYVASVNYRFFPNRVATRAEIFDFGSRIVGWASIETAPKTYQTITVVDGDTINYGDLKIRMIGLDAPESNTSRYGYIECFGKEASDHLKTLLKNAKEITIEKDPTQGETDKYGRTLAYVFFNGINMNTQMILDGFAFEYTYSKAYKYQKEHKNAEVTAKNANLGLWSDTTCGGDRKKWTNDEDETTPVADSSSNNSNTPTGSYTCGSKTYCSEMSTCEEARYYLDSCGLSRLDADKDGIPCEAICN